MFRLLAQAEEDWSIPRDQHLPARAFSLGVIRAMLVALARASGRTSWRRPDRASLPLAAAQRRLVTRVTVTGGATPTFRYGSPR
jgi:hypothetical protein